MTEFGIKNFTRHFVMLPTMKTPGKDVAIPSTSVLKIDLLLDRNFPFFWKKRHIKTRIFLCLLSAARYIILLS